MIFISFSSDFIPSIQWHTSFSKLMPGSCISCHILHFASRIASRIAYRHFIILLGLARGWLYPCCLFVLLGRAGRRVRYRGARWVCLWGSSQLWQLCRQDDHTLEITTIFAMLVCSLFCLPLLRCLPFACQPPNCHVDPLTHHCPSKPLIGYVTALLSPSYSVASFRWRLEAVPCWNIYLLVGISLYYLAILMHLYTW